MNERIKEIALESWAYVSHNDAPKGILKRDWYDQKFAELIIEDVCKNINQLDVWMDWTQPAVGHILSDKLKKHYGIK